MSKRPHCACGAPATSRCSARLYVQQERLGRGEVETCGIAVCRACTIRVDGRVRCRDHRSLGSNKVQIVALKPVCVRHRDGWCATGRALLPKPDTVINSVRTTCEHNVTLPWGFERRTPDCPDCLKRLEGRNVRSRAGAASAASRGGARRAS